MNEHIKSCSYIVEKVGSYYHCRDRYGGGHFSNSSFGVVMNDEVFNGLTDGRTSVETIIINSPVTVDDTILIEDFTKIVSYGKRWTAVNSLNKSMIQNSNYNAGTNQKIFLEGMTIDGNYANQTSPTRPIDFVITSSPSSTYADEPFPSFQLKNLVTTNTKGRGINIDFNWASSASLLLDNVSSVKNYYGGIAGERGSSLYLAHVSETHKVIGGVFTSYDANDTYSVYIENCTMGQYNPQCINGRVYYHISNHGEFTCPYIDISTVTPAIEFKGSKFNRIHDVFIHALGDSGTNTQPAINVSAEATNYCINNVFNSIYAGQGVNTGTKHFTYVIKENDANQNNNQYANINGEDCATGALYLMGSESKNQHQNIIGTVTEA